MKLFKVHFERMELLGNDEARWNDVEQNVVAESIDQVVDQYNTEKRNLQSVYVSSESVDILGWDENGD